MRFGKLSDVLNHPTALGCAGSTNSLVDALAVPNAAAAGAVESANSEFR